MTYIQFIFPILITALLVSDFLTIHKILKRIINLLLGIDF
jgi:hypothetical protein